MLDREKCEKFVRWAFEVMCEGYDLDSGDVQDHLEDLKLIEEREVDGMENEGFSRTLFFLKEIRQ